MHVDQFLDVLLIWLFRSSIMAGCKPAESPLAERKRRADVSRNDDFKRRVEPSYLLASLLLRSLLICCMCCSKGMDAAAILIGIHAEVVFRG